MAIIDRVHMRGVRAGNAAVMRTQHFRDAAVLCAAVTCDHYARSPEVVAMDMRWRGLVLLVWSVAVPCAVRAQQQPSHREICWSAIPANVDAGQLVPEVLTLLGRSAGFRAQCARIAAAPQVRVTLAVVSTLDSGRAQTVLQRYQAGALRAEVVLRFGENYDELLAHEFEHVLEQIDGVDLRDEAAHGRAWLLPSGAFETRRAFSRGVQVRRESEGLQRHAALIGPGAR